MFDDDMYGHVPTKRKPLATASLVFGILSIVLCSVIYLALPLGALAILFALLSHTEYKMAGKSRIGFLCGLGGIIATVVVTVSAFYYVLNNPTARAYLDYYMQMYTGDADFSLEDELENLLNGTYDDEAIPPVEIDEEGGRFL